MPALNMTTAEAVLSFQPQTTSDQIILELARLGVDHFFGVPGGGIEPLFESAERLSRLGGASTVLARHESGAASMADGYARASGKLGVVFATTGPGATNLATGLATAYVDRVPLVAITAQTPLPNFGLGAIQESSDTSIDTLALLRPVTRYSSFVSHVQQVQRKFSAAVMHAFGPTAGPTHLSIPVDVARSAPLADWRETDWAQLSDQEVQPPRTKLLRLREMLQQAQSPVLVVGRECHNAVAELLQFVERYEIPFVVSPSATGLIDRGHPLFRGVAELAGHQSAIDLIRSPSTDLVMVIGADLAECTVGRVTGQDLRSRSIVHISRTPELLWQSPQAQLHVLAEPAKVLTDLVRIPLLATEDGSFSLESVSNVRSVEFQQVATNEHSEKRNFCAQDIFEALPECVPEGTRYFADSGNSMLWAINALQPKMPTDYPEADFGCNGLVAVSPEFGAMGWAQAAAIGSGLADPERFCVCIVGDGSFLMAGQEITVAAQLGLPIVFIVLNDSVLGTVMHGQRIAESVPCAFQLPEVDFSRLAPTLGVLGFEVTSLGEFMSLPWETFATMREPVLIDARVDPNAVPPLGFRVDSLHAEKASTTCQN